MCRARFMVFAFIMLVFGASALAQGKCHDFRALYHQTLWVNLNTGVGEWYLDPDPIRGLFDLQPISPLIQYIPGSSAYPNAVAGRYWDYQVIWDFGDGNTITVGDYRASFPLPPGNAGMGTFMGTGKITGGTGVFEGATGTENESGPFLMWTIVDDQGMPWLTGKYSAMVSIRVCAK